MSSRSSQQTTVALVFESSAEQVVVPSKEPRGVCWSVWERNWQAAGRFHAEESRISLMELGWLAGLVVGHQTGMNGFGE
jgi:hypothetical protein